MYLRFVYSKPVDGMKSREGIFQAAGELAHDPLISDHVVASVDRLRLWFSANLERPERFSKTSSKGNYDKDTKGLSWFKPSAAEYISKAFELKSILEENGYAVDVLKETRLGYIVYEDDYQIVAEPFSDTVT
ncbi:MAG: hypothetical protein ACSHXB_14395 [Sulfitobacter sp.]